MGESLDTGQYLARLADMDAGQEAASMIELRRRFLGLETPPLPSEQSETGEEPDREVAAGAIRRLRSRFWELSPREARAALGELELDDFPDLEMVVEQLERVASLRRRFDEASNRVDPEFMEAFRQIVTAPADEAVVMRDKFVRRLAVSRTYKRAKRSAKTIKRRFPQLFALEVAWLSLILRLRKERKLASRVKKTWWVWIVVYVLFRLVMRLFGE